MTTKELRECTKCKTEFPIADFGKNKNAPDGIQWNCKKCLAVQTKKYTSSEKGKLARAAYAEKHKERDAEIRRARNKRRRPSPEQQDARWKVWYAIRSGVLNRPQGMEFHHPDYSRPYFGVWVTREDHEKIHHHGAPCPECKDFSESIICGFARKMGISIEARQLFQK